MIGGTKRSLLCSSCTPKANFSRVTYFLNNRTRVSWETI